MCARDSTPSAADTESLPPLPDSELGLDAVTVSNVLSEILGQSVVGPSRDSVRRFSRAYLKSLPLGYRHPVRLAGGYRICLDSAAGAAATQIDRARIQRNRAGVKAPCS